MNALIYYPGFEIEDENWLKFALIYLDHVRPIIPESGLCQLSDKTKHIMNTTDLIEPYIPQHQEGENASINALEQFEAYLKNPERYLSSHGFFKQFTETPQKVRARNYIQNWKDKRNQDFVLYSEKYSYSFSSYCVDEGLAHHTRHGLSMPRELAYVYMSFLADEISSREGLDSITDHSLSNKLLLRNDERRNRHIKSKFNIVKNSMQLEIPQNINTIELDRFVHLRSNDEFNKLRRNYMNEIDKYFEENANVSYNHLNNDILNISKAIKSLMIGFLGASFSIIVLSCVGVELETAFSIGAIPAVGQEVISIANDQQGIAKSVRQLRNKLMAKKFLAILNRL